MKPNRCKQQIENGAVAAGHMLLEFNTRGVAQILAQTDLDFVIMDMEHTGFSEANVADMIAWLKATDIAPFVRIPQVEYHFIARTLDVGALGIMVPNVKTADAAKAIVAAAKYAPMGERGVIMGSAHTDFASVDPAEFMHYSNENTTIICQIESMEGLENIEEIATIPGIDILWVGHMDLTQSMGIPGQFQEQRFLDALQRVVDVTNAHGLCAGIQPGNLEQAAEWMEIGFNVISYNGDFAVYMQALQEAVAGVRDLAKG